MNITKRNGSVEVFDAAKIRNALLKAFHSSSVFPSDEKLDSIVQAVVRQAESLDDVTVEKIQDIAEEKLMEAEFYKTAKAYILYRERRSGLRNERASLIELVGDEELDEVFSRIQKDYPDTE